MSPGAIVIVLLLVFVLLMALVIALKRKYGPRNYLARQYWIERFAPMHKELLELTELTLDEIAADLYPTFAYSEDSFGSRPETLLLCGFGDLAHDATRRFEDELAAKVERLPFRNAGLAGYLKSRKVQGVAA